MSETKDGVGLCRREKERASKKIETRVRVADKRRLGSGHGAAPPAPNSHEHQRRAPQHHPTKAYRLCAQIIRILVLSAIR